MTSLATSRTRCGAAVLLAFAVAVASAQARDVTARRMPTVDDAYRSIADLRHAYAIGELTPLDITLLYLQRIDAIDRAGPTLRSVIETNPDAAIAAQGATKAYREGRQRPLSGMAILVKDNIETGDRMRTTAGSLAFDHPALQDATVVAKLREAGAVVLGKTNLTEWAAFRGAQVRGGWSARGGFTRHPFILDRNPLGSSTGSAVAVAAGLATAAIGTETYGSIVAPAKAMGLVGIKPTVGLVSRAGVIPGSHIQDTVGPMARSVADAATVLSVIAGTDPADPITVGPYRKVVDYAGFVRPGSVRGKRIGIVRHPDRDGERDERAIERAVAILGAEGAVIVDPVTLPAMDEAFNNHKALLLVEFRHGIDDYLATRSGQPLRTLDDLIAFNEREAPWELQHFGQDMFHMARHAPPIDDPDYVDARVRASRTTGPDGIDATLAAYGVDALIGPRPVLEAAAIAGYPAMTVPTHFEAELPVGVMLFGTKWSEPTLISIAAAIERGAHAFRRPTYLPTLSAEHSRLNFLQGAQALSDR